MGMIIPEHIADGLGFFGANPGPGSVLLLFGSVLLSFDERRVSRHFEKQASVADSTTKATAPSEALLLQRIAKHDAEAISELYDLESTVLYSVIVRVLRSEADAEDVLQEVFLRVWERAYQYNPEVSPPSVWLIRIARNLAIDRLRSKLSKTQAREQDIESLDDIEDVQERTRPDSAAIISEHRDEIRGALDEMPRDQRVLIEFAYFRDYTQSELAEHFKLPLGTVKTRVRSAMAFLKSRLQHLL